MGTESEETSRRLPRDEPRTRLPDVTDRLAACPVCGHLMNATRGSKDAVCSNCGFKDSCCY